jgi:hypothetical protein
VTAAVMRFSRLGSTLRFRARPSATLVRRLLSACQPNIADWCIIAAWYEWFPAGASDFSGISFKTGDSVTITVTASSKTSGTAVIKNNSNGQSVSKSLTSSSALCQQDVEWIVEDFSSSLSIIVESYTLNSPILDGLVPFANFGTVTFTHTVGTLTNGATIGAGNAGTIDIVNSAGQVITSTTVADGSVTIKYV